MLKVVELAKSGDYEEALNISRKIESSNKNNALYFNVVGIVSRRLGLLEEARVYSRRALRIDKKLIAARMNIANIELDKGNIMEAIKFLEVIVQEEPFYHEAKANLALAYKNVGETERALNIYRKLKFNEPWAFKARFNYGTTLVSIQEFKEGWRNYEYRWKIFPGNKVCFPIQEKSFWRGEKGKTIALWREQGIGDDILFLSLLPEVQQMCSSLSVYIDPRLQLLCRRAMPDINFVKDIDELQNVDCDYNLPLGSVPGLIRNDISDFNRTVNGYLKADQQRVDAIRKELKLEGKTAIGISWKSFNTGYKTKSICLRDMERMFAGLDVVLVNLQYGDVADEIKEFKEEAGIEVLQCASVDNREDLDGLAALIEVCDLVVSTSNVTVHMAGALAKKTWVMLNYVPIYYWLLERTDSVWYPSLTLYRQPSLNDWDSVYTSIRKELGIRFKCG